MLCGDTVRHQLYSDFTAEQLALLGEGTIPVHVARLIINESSIWACAAAWLNADRERLTFEQLIRDDTTNPSRGRGNDKILVLPLRGVEALLNPPMS